MSAGGVVLGLDGKTVVAKTAHEPSKNRSSSTLIFPLVPDDSPEGRRRRRRFRRRMREMSGGEEEEEEKSEAVEKKEVEETSENPVKTTGDILYEGYGVHYVDLWVGCPPQRQTVIVDTGSSVTGFPCSGCHHCGGDAESNDEHLQYHTDVLFQPEQSTCFEKVTHSDNCLVGDWNYDSNTCRASKHYSEGSTWEAFEAVDQVYTGGDHNTVDTERKDNDSFKLHFACQDQVTGLFEQQLADGIMGMYNSPESFWYQMYTEKKMEQKAFSLCYAEPGHVERTGTLAGAMVLGGVDVRLHKTPMIWAEETSAHHDGKYEIHLEKVYLQANSPATSADHDNEYEKELASTVDNLSTLYNVQIFEESLNNKGPVIIDSGTTATYLTSQLLHHFVDKFNSMVPEDVMVLGSDKYYHLTLRQLQELPTVVFQIKGWQPKDKDEQEDPPETTNIPGIVGTDTGDLKHAGKSILIRMPPSHYLTRKDDDEEMDWDALDDISHYKFNIYFSKSSGKGATLGANFMRGHDILFDIENNRIGFAESDCEYASLVADDEDSG